MGPQTFRVLVIGGTSFSSVVPEVLDGSGGGTVDGSGSGAVDGAGGGAVVISGTVPSTPRNLLETRTG